jgi:hypothetical protein
VGEQVTMRRVALGLAVLALLGACSDDDGAATATTTTAASTDSSSSTTTAAQPTTASTEQPSTDNDPHDAAEAFMVAHFPGSNATLGEFQQGDSQSGEVPVFRPGEGGGTANLASTLLLRQADGVWVVIGAVNPNVTIEDPENGGEVPAGPVTISGVGRGFEALLVARAYDADGQMIAEATGQGGAQADPLPYEITLDLSAAESGAEVVITVNGGVGLESDPGEFSAIRVTAG